MQFPRFGTDVTQSKQANYGAIWGESVCHYEKFKQMN